MTESLRFVRPLGDGESLFDLKPAQNAVFRRGMTPTEVLELVVDSYSAAGVRQVEARNLRSAPFGGQAGFRFEMDYTLRSGLEASALVAGAIVKGRLHLVIYQGAPRLPLRPVQAGRRAHDRVAHAEVR